MPIHKKCKLVKKEKLNSSIFKFTLDAEEIAKDAMPRTIYRNKSK